MRLNLGSTEPDLAGRQGSMGDLRTANVDASVRSPAAGSLGLRQRKSGDGNTAARAYSRLAATMP
jgi:hypothetical protein